VHINRSRGSSKGDTTKKKKTSCYREGKGGSPASGGGVLLVRGRELRKERGRGAEKRRDDRGDMSATGT